MKAFKLFCPICGTEMKDIVYIEKLFNYHERQCPKCKIVYQLATEDKLEAESPEEIILIPRSKAWVKKNRKKLHGILE